MSVDFGLDRIIQTAPRGKRRRADVQATGLWMIMEEMVTNVDRAVLGSEHCVAAPPVGARRLLLVDPRYRLTLMSCVPPSNRS